MRCTSPRTVGFKSDGKTIAWSQKTYSKEFATFQLPCGKCLSCRLEYARTWAIRCTHEALMWPQNAFITLTYDDQHLENPELQYRDFQLFMKKLRKTQNEPIGVFVTGEYGDKTKRPHWHAILFNYWPRDAEYYRKNEQGDFIFTSATLDKIWGKNNPQKRPNEIGTVTFNSAGYVARYAAKKLVHGHDGEHQFVPISKKSSKHAIGKKYLEQHWQQVFAHGQIYIPDHGLCAIPRYYEKWLQKNQPEAWSDYIQNKKADKQNQAIDKARLEKELTDQINWQRTNGPQISKNKSRKIILQDIFNKAFNRKNND